MSEELDFPIVGTGPAVEEVRRRGLDRFLALAEHIRQLPYGRPAGSRDPLAVLKEQQGTCSFKHPLLAQVAHECGHCEVELVVGLYAMSDQNTPGVGVVLEPGGFVSIPEAHCYLRVNDRRYDFTGLSSGSASPFDALLSEHAILPKDLLDEKPRLHQAAIQAWAESHALTFAEAWALRESCISALVSNNSLEPTVSFPDTTGRAHS